MFRKGDRVRHTNIELDKKLGVMSILEIRMVMRFAVIWNLQVFMKWQGRFNYLNSKKDINCLQQGSGVIGAKLKNLVNFGSSSLSSSVSAQL